MRGEELVRIVLRSLKKFLADKVFNIKYKWNNKVRYLEAYGDQKDFSLLKIDDLAPKDDLEECEEYCKVLEYGIENEKVYNIAITGAYGSGKSSLLKTFEKKYVKYKYINISLASFISNEVALKNTLNQDNDEILKEQEKSIEKGILQQLFYRVDSNRIPYARFRKIKDVKISSIIKNIILFSITLGLAIIIFKPNLMEKFSIRVNDLYSFSNKYIATIIFLTFISLIIYNINLIVREFKARVNLSSLKFENAQIEFEKNGSESILNKYLDEILYFFEVTKYNVVVIEDLDRFNNTNIFTKLRELNQLINNYEKIKRKVVFIYAIKDDMFKNNERTKFFELIVPVIPVINSINSGDILLKKIRQDELGSDISNEFIIGVSVYIEDMRMLTNIYNEYRIYKKRLDDISLKAENILALVIYKNLYPGDFSDLLYNKGFLYSVFENKNNIIKEIEIDIDEEIRELKLKVDNIKKEYLPNIKELKIVFLSCITENKLQIMSIGGYTIDIFMSNDFDIYSFFNNSNSINYRYYQNGSGEYSNFFRINDVNNKLNGDITFQERLDYIRYKSDGEKNQLFNEISILQEKKRKLQSLKLYELIKTYGINKVLGEEIIKEKVIVYLLRNNKINETYVNYLTYFHNNIVTARDMNYILGVRNYEAQKFDYKLYKVDNIIGKLNEIEFEQKEILNFSLFKHILNNKMKYQEHFDILLKQLSDESEISIEFIDEVIHVLNEDEERVFWKSICKEWANLWVFIKNKCNYSNNKLEFYVYKLINYVDISAIKELNVNGELGKYIENNKELLKLFSKIDIAKIKEVICNLNIKFNYINIGEVNEQLINFIIEGKHYKINILNVEYILTILCDKDINSIRKKNLTTIREYGNTILNEYIYENILEYIEEVFLIIEDNTEEDINIVIELLNLDNEVVDLGVKKDIISKENFKLESINEVDEVLWDELLKQEKVKVSWDNIIYYYSNIKELDSVLINYLNNKNVYQQLSEYKLEDNVINSELIKTMLLSDKITIEAMNYLVNIISWVYTDYDTVEINEDYIDILIKKGILSLTKNIYDSLKDNHYGFHIRLIECNLKEFVENINDFNLDYQDIYQVLSLDNCEYIHKKIIISYIKEKIIKNIIEDTELIEELYKIVVIEKHVINLDENLYWNIFNNIIKENKIRLLSCQCKFLTSEQIDLSLEKIGGNFAKIIVPSSREKIKNSNDVMELASNLEICKYISSKSIVNGKDSEQYIQFNARRNKEN